MIQIHDILPQKALITRESANRLRGAFATASVDSSNRLCLDFSQIEAVTPSFIDEMLLVISQLIEDGALPAGDIQFMNVPTRLSAKFSALARAHDAQIVEISQGSRAGWVITRGSGPIVDTSSA